MNEGVVACGSGLHPADSGSVRFPAIPKEGKPTGESKYLGGTDPFEIGVSLSPQTARLKIEGSEYDCHVNNREEFAIEKAIDGTEDVVLSIGVNHHGRQKMIAHPDKHLFPITETTGQMMDEVSSQANQNANSNEAEIAMKRYSNEGAFAVEFNGGPQ